MEKMRMESINLTEQNIDKIEALFPNVITESMDENGQLKKAINFSLLKQILADDLVDGEEAYEFTWVGKKASIVEAGKSTRKTLRPCKHESKDWDITENLYIEGDNLEVMKLLQESYLGKVNMIFIDPPYNTGNDFIYKDNFHQSINEYEVAAGIYGENNNKLFLNSESNGRFHSDWCSMVYSRLLLARTLLLDDGVIFISLDDTEVDNLKKMCNEIFGEKNFVSWIIWQHSIQPKGYTGTFSVHHNHILCYRKSENFKVGSLERTDEDNKSYSNPDGDPNGLWRTGDVRNALYRPNLVYDIISPSGKIIKPCSNGWRWSKATVQEKIKTGEIIFSQDETRIIRKIYLKNLDGRTPETIWFSKDVGSTRDAMGELKKIFTKSPFETPKPTNLIRRMLSIMGHKKGIVLDFFSGSASTAHAVMQQNADDGGDRKFIMIQLPEPCGENTQAFTDGYKNICEIGKDRIRRAGEKIKEEAGLTAQDLDIGFRVLKLDETNMKDVYYATDQYSQGMLAGLESNIKEDRTDLDLLFGCLLEWGLPLSLPHKSEKIDGVVVHTINDGDLIACFEENISEGVVKEIAKRQPLRVVFRDSSFANSPGKINVEEIFKLMAPNTSIKVL